MKEVTLAEGDSLEDVLADLEEGGVVRLGAGEVDGGVTLRKSLTLVGDGEASRLVGGGTRVLRAVGEGVVVTLEDLVVADGSADVGAGVLLVDGASLVARRVRFEANAARHKGGAIALSDGRCELLGCELVDNRAAMGGAIYVDGLGTLELQGGSIAGNKGTTGAGVHVADGALARLTGVVFSDQAGDGLDVSVAGSLTRAPEVVLTQCQVGEVASRPSEALVIE